MMCARCRLNVDRFRVRHRHQVAAENVFAHGEAAPLHEPFRYLAREAALAEVVEGELCRAALAHFPHCVFTQ